MGRNQILISTDGTLILNKHKVRVGPGKEVLEKGVTKKMTVKKKKKKKKTLQTISELIVTSSNGLFKKLRVDKLTQSSYAQSKRLFRW